MKYINKTKRFTTTSLCLAFIVFMIAFTIIAVTSNKFNPEEDVCTEQVCVRCEGHYKYESSCKEWRSKTKCELDPEAEGCVCDEWGKENGEMGYEIISYINCSNNNTRSCVCPSEYCVHKIIRTTICLKSHESNECEKGNPSYVWDTFFYDCKGIYSGIDCEKYGEKIKRPLPFCRKKTIQDYSCEELKRTLFLNSNNRICSWGGILHINSGCFMSPKCDCKTKEEIYDISISKGCEI